MRWLVDLAYTLGAVITLPIWASRLAGRGLDGLDWRGRLGSTPRLAPGPRRVLIHAVSVGEVNAVRLLVEELASRPDPPEIVIAATTDTGHDRAVEFRWTVGFRWTAGFGCTAGCGWTVTEACRSRLPRRST